MHPLDLLLALLQLAAGAGATVGVQWLLPRLRRTQAGATMRLTTAEAGKTEAEALTAQFSFYREQLEWMKGRISDLETRYNALEAEIQELHAAIAAEPDGGARIRGRLRRAPVPPAELVINSGQTTINGGVAGGDIGTIQKGS